MRRFESKQDIQSLTEGFRESGDRTAREGKGISEDAETIAEIHRTQYDQPTKEDQDRIEALKRQIRQRVEAVMSGVQKEQQRLESEMRQEASDRERAAKEQQLNEQEYRKFYGLNNNYDSAAVDQIVAATRESVYFLLTQREQTENSQVKLSEEMSEAVNRMRSAFHDIMG